MSKVNKVKKVSKVKIVRACPYLQRTGEWFERKFGRQLTETIWDDVAFLKLVQRKRDAFIYRVGDKLGKEKVIDQEDIGECAGELYELLVSQDKQGSTKQDVFKFAPLEKQFAYKYEGNVHEELMEKINLCHKLWVIGKGIRWHSPYLSIVQSSGFGKSRACKEIATSIVDENWLTVYICCRDSESIGYPPQTQPAVEFFKKLLTASPEEAQRLLGYWIKWLIYFRFVFWLAFVSGSMDIETIVNNVTSMDMDCLLKKWKIDSFTDVQYDHEKENKERMAFWSLCFERSHDHLMKRMFNFINSFAENGEMPEKIQEMLKCKHVLLVIDEARFLSNAAFSTHSNVTLFRIFRAALKDIRSGFFAVVVDTLSRIANFAPSRKLDPSLRYIEKDDCMGKDLFHPFTAVTTMDALCDPNNNLDEAKYRFTLGRPLWKITLDYYIATESSVTSALDELITFGGVCMPNDEGKIACIAVLTGINISPLSTIANELVASHMATCLAIDSNRESLFMMYPVEPVLAEAAKHYIKHEYGHRKLSKVFEPLQDCFRIGAIDRGHNGELIAKLLILLGMFQISEVGSVVSSCQCVLDALFGKDVMNNESLAHAGDEFSFNCFTELVRNSKYWVESDAQHELASYFNRGVAIQLPRGHPGADLLLPIRRKSICEKSGCDQYHYKYLLIQVKNYK
jgi:hypothetical protein